MPYNFKKWIQRINAFQGEKTNLFRDDVKKLWIDQKQGLYIKNIYYCTDSNMLKCSLHIIPGELIVSNFIFSKQKKIYDSRISKTIQNRTGDFKMYVFRN